jgi:hypothetical protein
LEKVNIRHSVRRQSAAPAGGQNSTRRVVLTEHVGAVDGEQLCEPFAATMDPALDRTAAQSQTSAASSYEKPDAPTRMSAALVRQQLRERPADFLEFQSAVLLGR